MGNPKQLLFDEDARSKLVSGIDKVADTVKVTLGPRARFVAIDKDQSPLMCNDGVTIAKELELKDKFENMGAKLLREVATRTQDNAGDGTSTSILLAQAMVKEGVKNISSGANSVAVKQGIEKAAKVAVDHLKSVSKPVNDKESIKQVATISANNDEYIGSLIADAMEKVGQDGVISVEDSKSFDTSLSVVEGMEFDNGFISPYMAQDQEKMRSELENAQLLLTDKKISGVKEIIPALEYASNQGRPLVIIADDIEGDAQAGLILNIIRGGLKVCAVKAPGVGDEKKEMLEDIAALTGAKVVSEDKAMKLEDFNESWLGSTKKINVTSSKTTIIEGEGSQSAIGERKTLLHGKINNESSDFKREELKKRLAKLGGGIALIKVGAVTESELEDKKLRIDDALHATKAATLEGVVTGGGLTLLHASKKVASLHLDGDEKVGAKLVEKALVASIRQIAANSGVEGAVVLARLEGESENVGFNARTDTYEDLFKAGVLDPTKVVRNAIQNSASIASMVLTTEALMADFDEEKDSKFPNLML